MLVEVLRVSAQADVEAVHASPEWRTHIALQATLLGLPEGELRSHLEPEPPTNWGNHCLEAAIEELR